MKFEDFSFTKEELTLMANVQLITLRGEANTGEQPLLSIGKMTSMFQKEDDVKKTKGTDN
ncbi:MAG: hypothetical protein U9R50_11840 [Campylobacterota bacterium]|nr:hypothetical protein [Campylobacterota bacterium]